MRRQDVATQLNEAMLRARDKGFEWRKFEIHVEWNRIHGVDKKVLTNFYLNGQQTSSNAKFMISKGSNIPEPDFVFVTLFVCAEQEHIFHLYICHLDSQHHKMYYFGR